MTSTKSYLDIDYRVDVMPQMAKEKCLSFEIFDNALYGKFEEESREQWDSCRFEKVSCTNVLHVTAFTMKIILRDDLVRPMLSYRGFRT